ncbi:hypothetical protein [Roseibium salinum]|uniref:Uncharacterized protein n=1 Tax=Roseibium salinum TaxID=1604349 RepID=A0ABT3R4M6_9HYPH|nr:hypothetical protein [Roseibium sp. DSM 29163]MCX2724221.1 hypothetical protein [Roseibium sp. DSM 29163]
MADGPKKSGLKSAGGNKPLRSRGFLSSPGGQMRAPADGTGEAPGEELHHRSRGSRQVSATPGGKPQALSSKPKIRPYSLDEK